MYKHVDLFDLMVAAAEAQRKAIAAGARLYVEMNPAAHEWALEMERLGLLKRRDDGLFHMNDMFELWKKSGGSFT